MVIALTLALVAAILVILFLYTRMVKLNERASMLQTKLKDEAEHAHQIHMEQELRWQQSLSAVREELQKVSMQQISAGKSALQEQNRQQMDTLLQPIRDQFDLLHKIVHENSTQNEVNKQELKTTFESTLKLFQLQQQSAVESLRLQTERIGTDANNLTKALKGDNKVQGDWGEMVLETLLENSGLHRDEEYFVQQNCKDEQGGNNRPDVIVRFPEGRSVVIDSKVSLTNYTDAIAAQEEKTRDHLLQEHARSVRRHIDELAAKKYDTLVEDAIGFVLMFVPNENSYIAAMKQQPDLSRYAYQKHIIVISPSNLMMALQLAYNLWQYDRQNKNVEKIVKTAADLYDKVAGFADSFAEIDSQLKKLEQTYQTARERLYDGKGNVMRRVESLREMGVNPKKQLSFQDN